MENARLLSPDFQDQDSTEKALRPKSLSDFVGQEGVRQNLSIFVHAAKSRGEPLDHVLFCGPPGLGKTTLAQIIATEMGVGFRATSGPLITKAGDLAAILTNLQSGDVLFIDEIHRLNASIEEVLYPAMEDYKLDLIIGDGPAARTVRIDLQPFTLVAATTRTGLLTSPLRDRFGIPMRLDYYTPAELAHIITRASGLLSTPIDADGVDEIANRSRGTPRIAGRLLRRVRDFAHVIGSGRITRDLAQKSLSSLGVDRVGLDDLDLRYLTQIAQMYGGGPVGVDTLAAALSEQRDTLEEVVEPYLIQKGYLQRTPRGRLLTQMAFDHLKLPLPANGGSHPSLFPSRPDPV